MTEEIKTENKPAVMQIIDEIADVINQVMSGDGYESLVLKVVRLQAELAVERERVASRDKIIDMLRAGVSEN